MPNEITNFLTETTNETSKKNNEKNNKTLSSSNSSFAENKKGENSERKEILDFLKNFAYKTKTEKLKFELKEIIKFLNGKEMDEVVELKKIIEELLIENEELIEKKI